MSEKNSLSILGNSGLFGHSGHFGNFVHFGHFWHSGHFAVLGNILGNSGHFGQCGAILGIWCILGFFNGILSKSVIQGILANSF